MEKQLSSESLDCWQDSKKLTILVYSIADPMDLSSDWDFSRQMRRASISVMNNISEGYSSYNPEAIVQFMGYALGSCSEVLTMTIIGKELGYFDQSTLDQITTLYSAIKGKVLNLIKYRQRRSR